MIGPTLKLRVFVGIGQSMNDFLRKKKMIEHTTENCGKLANFIVDGMGLDDLINHVVEGMSDDFEQHKEGFFEAVEAYEFDRVPVDKET